MLEQTPDNWKDDKRSYSLNNVRHHGCGVGDCQQRPFLALHIYTRYQNTGLAPLLLCQSDEVSAGKRKQFCCQEKCVRWEDYKHFFSHGTITRRINRLCPLQPSRFAKAIESDLRLYMDSLLYWFMKAYVRIQTLRSTLVCSIQPEPRDEFRYTQVGIVLQVVS